MTDTLITRDEAMKLAREALAVAEAFIADEWVNYVAPAQIARDQIRAAIAAIDAATRAPADPRRSVEEIRAEIERVVEDGNFNSGYDRALRWVLNASPEQNGQRDE